MTSKRDRSPNDDSDGGDERIPKRVAGPANDALRRLSRLLDLTSTTSPQDILAQFSAIAQILLHEVNLQVTSKPASRTPTFTTSTEYELLEIEFYLWKSDGHEDPFTHGSEEQRQSGHWYFHRAPTKASGASSSSGPRPATAAGGYRGGTRKGLDLTFGSPLETAPISTTSRYFKDHEHDAQTTETTADVPPSVVQDIRGGILLRSIQRLSDEKVISGPSVLVDEILRASGASTIVELVNQVWGGDTTAWPYSSPAAAKSNTTPCPSLKLVPSTAQSTCGGREAKIYCSPRIGLDLSHSSIPLPVTPASTAATLSHPRLTFISRKYRYFTHPDLLTVNGRGHTFLGVYQSLVSEEKCSDVEKLKERLGALTGLKPNTVSKYLEECLDSVADGRISALVGMKGKGAGSNPVSALRMFGTLQRCGH